MAGRRTHKTPSGVAYKDGGDVSLVKDCLVRLQAAMERRWGDLAEAGFELALIKLDNIHALTQKLKSPRVWRENTAVDILQVCNEVAKKMRPVTDEGNKDLLECINTLHGWAQKIVEPQSPVLVHAGRRKKAIESMIDTLGLSLKPTQYGPVTKPQPPQVGAVRQAVLSHSQASAEAMDRMKDKEL